MEFIEVLPYIGSLVGAAGGVIALAKGFRDSNREESRKLFDDALKLKADVQEMYNDLRMETDKNRELIATLNNKVERLKRRVGYLRTGVDILICQIEAAGLSPEWRPTDENTTEKEE